MFEALRARFNRKATDGEPAESRQLKRAKNVQRRRAREAYLNGARAREDGRGGGYYGGGGYYSGDGGAGGG